MKIFVALVLLAAATQAKSVGSLAELQSVHDWEVGPAAPEANSTGLVLETNPQPEDAGKVSVEHEDRIVGGTAAALGQFPWQALVVNAATSFCGGSLISTGWVLTAAHCIHGYSTFHVTLGSTKRSGGQAGSVTQSARQAIAHGGYNPSTVANDIGLLRLAAAVPLSNHINVVRLPRNAGNTYAGSAAIVSGFGRINSANNDVSNILLYANAKIVTNADCVKTYGSAVQDTNICTTGASNPCTGDSGGPLVAREADGLFTLVGAVSFGVYNCAAGRPLVYARVSKYLAWISSNTGVVGGA